MTADELNELIVRGLEVAGVAVIVLGVLFATLLVVRLLRPPRDIPAAYDLYRQWIGRAYLLGLEFLVAADIVRTIAIEPTFTSVGILAVIVLIRTFLSWTLDLELTGNWPWKQTRPLDQSAVNPSSNQTPTPDLTRSDENRRTG